MNDNNSNIYNDLKCGKENKYQSTCSNDNKNKIHLDLKKSGKKEENYFNHLNIKNRDNRYTKDDHQYNNGINNFRGWKGRGRGNWRGRGKARGNFRGKGRGFYRGGWRGRGKHINYNNYTYLYDNNNFYENNDENNNKPSEKGNQSKKINDSKNNSNYSSTILNELNNSDSKNEDYDDDEDSDYYKLFSNESFLNSLSDLNLNRLFNGLDLIGCDIFEDMGSLTVSRPFRDELLFNFREGNKGLTKEFVNNLPKMKIDNGNKKDINPNKCLICTEVFKEGDEAIKIQCNHCFHSKCILEWFVFSNYCPICRFVLEEEKKD